MNDLFSPFCLRGLALKNRIVMAPMCQYAVTTGDGRPTSWHYVHYVSRAVGGAGLVMIEMTSACPGGRITRGDLGLWSDRQIANFARIVDECHRHGARVGVQLAHAGRKAEDSDRPVAPSPVRFPAPQYKQPSALSERGIHGVIGRFAAAARRAVRAGVDAIEVHAAHGYLIHQFQSPLTNRRTDIYGRDLARFGVEVVAAVRAVVGPELPLTMRISAVEYADSGYGLEHAVQLCRRYRDAGVDIFSVSSGGESPFPADWPGHQVPLAAAIRAGVGVPVIAAGRLEEPFLADQVVRTGAADLVAVGRGMLRDPYWALSAARQLGVRLAPPKPYSRAFEAVTAESEGAVPPGVEGGG